MVAGVAVAVAAKVLEMRQRYDRSQRHLHFESEDAMLDWLNAKIVVPALAPYTAMANILRYAFNFWETLGISVEWLHNNCTLTTIETDTSAIDVAQGLTFDAIVLGSPV